MPSLYNTPFGRGSKIVLPSDKSKSQSYIGDYCFQTSNQTNMMAWMDRQSNKVAVAFRGLQYPTPPTRRTEAANSISRDIDDKRRHHKMENGFEHRLAVHQDSMSEYIPLDLECKGLAINLQKPCYMHTTSKALGPEDNNSGNKNGATKCIERNARPTNTPLRRKRGSSPIQEEQQDSKTRKINSHLATPEAISLKFETLRISPSNANTEKSLPSTLSTGIAKLVAENRQLEAFKQALRLASNDAFKHVDGINFATEVGLCNYPPGISYPVINIIVKGRREDIKLQCSLAHHLLRGMLKQYGDLPFPDRVDIRGSDFQRGHLLVSYTADTAETDGECECVRLRIASEMRLEKLSARHGSELF
ncbi:hypothetical protein GQX73_g2272 [Xylaria multiplex]|uniref:Uncharacterized protein n=1 Tax=Xylaria multiplex TaxID=323545 RepID=A0A7C8IUF7_9PEZI|nr:hypothetical protein GQX73_g2272 [Xylaria multiplex]